MEKLKRPYFYSKRRLSEMFPSGRADAADGCAPRSAGLDWTPLLVCLFPWAWALVPSPGRFRPEVCVGPRPSLQRRRWVWDRDGEGRAGCGSFPGFFRGDTDSLARLSRDFTDVKQCCSSHWIFVLTNIGIFQV